SRLCSSSWRTSSSTSATRTSIRGSDTRELGASIVSPLLDVYDLRVTFPTEDGLVRAVDGISYSVDEGRTLGIVGESGSGKSVSSLTKLGLTRTQGAEIAGEILFEGQDLVSMSGDQLRRIRRDQI